MPNEFIKALTGLGVVTTPAVTLWLLVGCLTLAINKADKIYAWERTKPRLAAFVGFLEGAGFDPKKTATKLRDFLKSAEQ